MATRIQDAPSGAQTTSSDNPNAPTFVLKHRELQGLFDALGNIDPVEGPDRGLYLNCTRFLSRYVVRFEDGHLPVGLGAFVSADNTTLFTDLTNPPHDTSGGALVKSGSVYLHRECVLFEQRLLEKIVVSNPSRERRKVRLVLEWEADFRDLFEIRGYRRQAHGRILESDDPAVSRYLGLDGIERRARIEVHGADQVDHAKNRVDMTFELAPRQHTTVVLSATCELAKAAGETPHQPAPIDFQGARKARAEWRRALSGRVASIRTSHEVFQAWIDQSWSDLSMLLTETPHGLYPYAGTPWFCAPFGRDGLITAMQTLWFAPDIARGVLAYLAAHQATGTDPVSEAEPGKILHERRKGEMVALEEVPYGAYYGSSDAPALFLDLLGRYVRQTGDIAFLKEIEDPFRRCLGWVRKELANDGFIYYSNRNEDGLVHQGWKDADDAVILADGSLAEPPFALAEIQGYAYAALRESAGMLEALDDSDGAASCTREADSLKERFHENFWLPELGAAGAFALALAGDHKPCGVVSSNAAQCLFSGIVTPECAVALTRTLRAESIFSGWGLRTLGSDAAAYSPLSYHNGSVWPHDTAIGMAGLARYGQREFAEEILDALFAVARDFRFRLPELFSGFQRREHSSPIRYPNACSPQAWAAGCVFMMLEAATGLRIDGAKRELHLCNPWLPRSVDRLELNGLRVGEATVTIHLIRRGKTVDFSLRDEKGPPVRVVFDRW